MGYRKSKFGPQGKEITWKVPEKKKSRSKSNSLRIKSLLALKFENNKTEVKILYP